MRNRGFTLIEMLVVMLIIGISVSLATIAFQDNRAEQLQREARRLTALLELGLDESAMRSNIIGIRFEPRSYAFFVRAGDGWKEIEDDPILRRREIPEPAELQLLVDGLAADKASPAATDKDQTPPPQVYLLPSGEALPFEVSLVHPDLPQYYRVRVELTGKVSLHAED